MASTTELQLMWWVGCGSYSRKYTPLGDIVSTLDYMYNVAMRLELCMVSNSESGADEETLKLDENSCLLNEVGKLMEQDPTEDNNNHVTFMLHSFPFNKNNAISIISTVKVCPTRTSWSVGLSAVSRCIGNEDQLKSLMKQLERCSSFWSQNSS
ncbi:uncharacterized protein LOC121387191 [Gigantopelta aegis]|uniref:uncharacterized protein LOC121387191 n=1 Tax=Gigantopelta aegis TaxID=1735272 RepID=UPI001B88AFB7|nr:uncharacterized protein LOC121387191 [Gigantopelta aegis]XP_041374161.1 uncharacterized protein LOC121387191 [Gigantopelta aegis]